MNQTDILGGFVRRIRMCEPGIADVLGAYPKQPCLGSSDTYWDAYWRASLFAHHIRSFMSAQLESTLVGRRPEV
jgi:hypothetical protein